MVNKNVSIFDDMDDILDEDISKVKNDKITDNTKNNNDLSVGSKIIKSIFKKTKSSNKDLVDNKLSEKQNN